MQCIAEWQWVFLKMPVDVVQYRVIVTIFNNWKLIIHLAFEFPPCSKLSNHLPKYDSTYVSLLFYIVSNTSINEKVSISNKTILNVLNNYIPHEMITCDGKDPPWFTSRIKYLIESKNKLRNNNYRRFESNSHLLSTLNKSS